MLQICRKDKEKVYGAICTGNIDEAEMSFFNQTQSSGHIGGRLEAEQAVEASGR